MSKKVELTSSRVASIAAKMLKMDIPKDFKSVAGSALTQAPYKHINLHPGLWSLLRLSKR